MQALTGEWDVSRLAGVPEEGVFFPGAVVEGADGLVLKSDWALRWLDVVWFAVMTALVATASWSRTLDAFDRSVISSLGVLGFVAAIVLKRLLTGRLELDRRTGFGTLEWRAWPLRRRWAFPLTAIRQVRLSRMDTHKGNRFAGRVAFDLCDTAGRHTPLTVAECRSDRKAERLADRLARWLGVERFIDCVPEFVTPTEVATRSGRSLRVAPAPVPAKERPFGETAVFRTRDENRLLVGPTRAARIRGVACAAVGTAMCLYGACALLTSGPVLGAVPLVSGLVCLWAVVSVMVKERRWVLDRKTGRATALRESNGRAVRHVDLEAAVAVQMLYTGWERRSRDGPHRVFELNVVFMDGSRLSLERHASRRRLRSDAQTIAGFLGLPIVDHMAGL